MTHWVLIIVFSGYNAVYSAGPFISKSGCEEAARIIKDGKRYVNVVYVKDELK